MSENLTEMTVVLIHFQTPDLLTDAVGTFRSFYPDVQMMILDNGSRDHSEPVLKNMERKYSGKIRMEYLKENIYHGPAMDLAMRTVMTPFVFFLDTDVRVKKGGFLEPMIEEFRDQGVYGVGRLNTVNKRGFSSDSGTTIILTPYMMLRRTAYFQFPPFGHHGMPTLKNFSEAHKKGYRFCSFPVDDFIEHFGRGTAGRYGYKLGLKGRWSFVMNKLGL